MSGSTHDSARRPLIAVYPGSFDPLTHGHVDLVQRAAALFDTVIVAVGQHPVKSGFLSVDLRCRLISESLAHVKNVSCAPFEGLAVDFCRRRDARVILRGVRGTRDFESEFQMGLANQDMAPGIETVFLVPRPELQYVSSSLIREIASYAGDISRYVPACVATAMRAQAEQGRD